MPLPAGVAFGLGWACAGARFGFEVAVAGATLWLQAKLARGKSLVSSLPGTYPLYRWSSRRRLSVTINVTAVR